jgi:hypothetical protein
MRNVAIATIFLKFLVVRDATDTDFAGYPAGLSKSRLPDIRPDIRCRPDAGYPAGFSTQHSSV